MSDYGIPVDALHFDFRKDFEMVPQEIADNTGSIRINNRILCCARNGFKSKLQRFVIPGQKSD